MYNVNRGYVNSHSTHYRLTVKGENSYKLYSCAPNYHSARIICQSLDVKILKCFLDCNCNECIEYYKKSQTIEGLLGEDVQSSV